MNGTLTGFPLIEKIINEWAVLLVLCLWIFSIARFCELARKPNFVDVVFFHYSQSSLCHITEQE